MGRAERNMADPEALFGTCAVMTVQFGRYAGTAG